MTKPQGYFQKAYELGGTAVTTQIGMETAIFNQGAILVRRGKACMTKGLALMEQTVNVRTRARARPSRK